MHSSAQAEKSQLDVIEDKYEDLTNKYDMLNAEYAAIKIMLLQDLPNKKEFKKTWQRFEDFRHMTAQSLYSILRDLPKNEQTRGET